MVTTADPMLFLALTARLVVASCEDPFGQPDDVLQLHLRLSPSKWDEIRLEKNPGLACDAQYTYQQVEFRCGDAEKWIPIGVRHKRGDQRGADAPQKPPLKLDLNRYIDGQRWPKSMGRLGFRKLTLNNGQANLKGGVLPNLVAERVSWDLMREVTPFASGAAWAQLWVHFVDDSGAESVEYRGVYLMIEDLDRTAMRRRHGASCGALLKTTVGRCREDTEYDDGDPSPPRDAYDTWFTRGGDAESALELDDLLRQEALRDILGNSLDGPLGGQFNNYYRAELRGQPRSRFYPWDLDWLFTVYPLEIAPTTPLDTTCSPLGQKTRCHPNYRERYRGFACDLTQGTLSAEHVLSMWNAREAVVAPLLSLEADAVWGGTNPLDPEVRGSFADVSHRMQDWVPARIAAVRSELGCSESCSAPEASCAVGGCVGTRVCADGAWGACVVTPATETCNGADDDCDGVVDEGCPLEAEACVTSTPKPRANLSSCACSSAEGVWFAVVLAFLRKRPK